MSLLADSEKKRKKYLGNFGCPQMKSSTTNIVNHQFICAQQKQLQFNMNKQTCYGMENEILKLRDG